MRILFIIIFFLWHFISRKQNFRRFHYRTHRSVKVSSILSAFFCRRILIYTLTGSSCVIKWKFSTERVRKGQKCRN